MLEDKKYGLLVFVLFCFLSSYYSLGKKQTAICVLWICCTHIVLHGWCSDIELSAAKLEMVKIIIWGELKLVNSYIKYTFFL